MRRWLWFGIIRIPDELLERMKAAAELYGTTELKSCLDEMEQLGEGGRQLADHLRGHLPRLMTCRPY